MDEVAVFEEALPASMITQHYRDAHKHQPFSTVDTGGHPSPAPPAPPVVDAFDPLDYPPVRDAVAGPNWHTSARSLARSPDRKTPRPRDRFFGSGHGAPYSTRRCDERSDAPATRAAPGLPPAALRIPT